MDKVAIVILNYLNYKDTIECVESLKENTYKNKEIIIVDNASTNESWDMLSQEYKNKNIHLLKNRENLGFARGNNTGIDYARNVLNCNFVLLVNNDTVFIDKSLLQNLMENYEPNVGVIGSRIISADNQEQNPVNTVVSKEKIHQEYQKYKGFKYNLVNSELYRRVRRIKILKKINSIIKGDRENLKVNKVNSISKDKKSLELVLHGACMLLTKDYFKYYPGLFPKTFLYYEENILTLLTKKVGLEKKFINTSIIYHKEDQSSEMSFKNLNKIKIKYMFESMKKCEEIFDLSYEEVRSNYF